MYCFRERFLNNTHDRARLTQQLYNLASNTRDDDAYKLKKLHEKLNKITIDIDDLQSYTSMKPLSPAKRTGAKGTTDKQAKKGQVKGSDFVADGLELIDSIGLPDRVR